MRDLRAAFVSSLLAMPAWAQAEAPSTASTTAGVQARVHALLVGVTEYPELRKAMESSGRLAHYESRIRLEGPRNDVVRMQQVVRSVLGAAPEDITELTFQGAPDRQPTRRNIVANLETIAKKAGSGDLVVVFLAGHGAQVPDTSGDESDGLDEVFLPQDTSTWDERTKTVQGALLDDDLAPLLSSIRAGGARIWLVVDSCHAGTLMRGGDDVTRSLKPSDLGLNSAQESSTSLTTPERAPQPSLDELGSGVTALYAVHPTQLAVETSLPVGSSQRHGVFTWFLTEQLARCGPGVTFSELHQRVCASLFHSGRGHLTPVLEGEGAVTVLRGSVGGTRLQLRSEMRRLLVDGGDLHGIKVGDVLDVYGPGKRGDRASVLGRVEVVSTTSTTSEVVPTKAIGIPGEHLPKGGDLLPVELSQASLELRKVRLFAVGTGGKAIPSDELPMEPCRAEPVLQRALWVDEPSAADYVVRQEGANWVFEPSTDKTLSSLTANQDTFASMVHRMFRARGLLAIAASPLGRLPTGVKLRIDLLTASGEDRGTLQSGQSISPGARARITLRNEGSSSMDLRAYCIDSELGVTPLLPAALGASAEVGAGKETSTTVSFNDATLGYEQLLVIASPAGTAHLDAIAQELSVVRAAHRGDQRNGILSELLGETHSTRGGRAEIEDCAGVTAIPYRIEWGAPSSPSPGSAQRTGWASTIRARLQDLCHDEWQPKSSEDRDRSLGEIYERVAPAVVAIHSDGGHGTGFLIDAKRGLVLTNHHVVANSTRFSTKGLWLHQLIFGDLDSRGFMKVTRSDVSAEVIHSDEHVDLALLQIQGDLSWLQDRPVVRVMPTEVKPARPCAIVGHPSSGMLWSIRSGLVSALGSWPTDHIDNIVRLAGLPSEARSAATAELSKQKPYLVLLSTCGANPGDSGSPLVDESGNLIAVTFAVPRERMDKEFTYHVALEEVLSFLDSAPKAEAPPRPQIPSPWFPPANVRWIPSAKETTPGQLLLGSESAISIFLDFDGDSTARELEDAEIVAAISSAPGEAFDFELVYTRRRGMEYVSYDSDADGRFDLVRFDRDGDRRSDLEFRLDATTGTWQIMENTRTPLLQLNCLGAPYADTRSATYRRAAKALQQIFQ